MTAVKDHRSSMGSQASSRLGQVNSTLKSSFGGTPNRLDNNLTFAIQSTPGNGYANSFNPQTTLQFKLVDQNEIPEEDLDDTTYVNNDSGDDGFAQSLSPTKERNLLKQDEFQNFTRRKTMVQRP